jgi:hypothetical protein
MNYVNRHRVIDSMAAHKQYAVPATHVVPFHPTLGIIRELPDAIVQLIEILIRLELGRLLRLVVLLMLGLR